MDFSCINSEKIKTCNFCAQASFRGAKMDNPPCLGKFINFENFLFYYISRTKTIHTNRKFHCMNGFVGPIQNCLLFLYTRYYSIYICILCAKVHWQALDSYIFVKKFDEILHYAAG